MKRKALSVLLVLALVISSMTVNSGKVYAEDSDDGNWEYHVEGDWQYRVENGEAIITIYFGPGGEVVIPSTLGGYPVKEIAMIGLMHQGEITSIVIPEGVERIGDFAFHKLYYMESIVIPNTVREIGYKAFGECFSLKSVSLPEGLTAISSNLFNGCTSLQSVYIPSSVTTIRDYAFYGCSSLTDVSIPNNVTYIGSNAFEGCTSLTEIVIPSSVKNIGYDVFEGCTGLTSITFENAYTNIGSSPDTIPAGAVIKGYTGSTAEEYANTYGRTFIAIDPPPSQPPLNFTYTIENGEVTITGYIGSDSVVDIPETIEGYPVTKIGTYAFVACSATTINLPSTLEIIDFGAFDYCRNLTSITIPSSVVTIEGYAFNACESLTEVIILNPNAYIGDFAETFPEQTKIVGYDPSTAKDYAIKYGRTFEVYGGGQPGGEEDTGDGSNIQIIGEVGASTITITAPLVISFVIDPNDKERPLVTEDLVLSNEGNAAVNVYVKSIESQDMQIVPSNTHSPEEWKRLSKYETERKLALLMNGKDLANADNLFLVNLKGKETKSLPIDVKHGLAFPTARSCTIKVILSYSLD